MGAATFAGSAATLISAAATVVTVFIRNRSRERRLAIERAPEGDRARIIAGLVPMFDIKSAGLTQDQQFQLALQQLASRDSQMSRTLRWGAFATVILAATTIALAYSEVQSVKQIVVGPDPSATVIHGDGNQVIEGSK
jgi:hypothetical protein